MLFCIFFVPGMAELSGITIAWSSLDNNASHYLVSIDVELLDMPFSFQNLPLRTLADTECVTHCVDYVGGIRRHSTIEYNVFESLRQFNQWLCSRSNKLDSDILYILLYIFEAGPSC